MRRLILLGLALMLILCACQNSLQVKPTELEAVNGTVLIDRSVLKAGDSYAIGYNNGNIRSTQVKLAWNQCMDKDFLCYKLFRNGTVRKTILDPLVTEWLDSLRTQDTIYDYRLVTIIKNGMAVDDTIQIKTPQFLPPNELDYDFITPTSVYIAWENRAESAAGYVIEKYNFTSEVTTMFESPVTNFTDNDVISTGNYRYRVKAVNQYEETGWSYWLLVSNSVLYDFEGNNGNFVSNNAGGWQWGTSSFAGSYSGTRVWGTNLAGSYSNGAIYSLQSPVIAIPANSVLEFFHIYQIEDGWDGGNVKISTNGGASWTLLQSMSGYPYANIQSSGEPGYSGQLSEWTPAVFDLSAYGGQNVSFRWDFTSDNSVVYQGWFIDNVRIGPEMSKAPIR
jgi:hypothetical protein